MEEREEEIKIETCAFCGKTLQQVANLIKSPIDDNIYICDKCSEISFSTINGGITKKSASNFRRNWKSLQDMEILEKTSKWDDIDFDMTPREIHEELDRYVIGQEKAKKVLSVAMYNHNKRLNDASGLIKKSNILIAGPSGTGKTLLAKTLAGLLNVPFITVDATSMTEAGYVGQNIESCLERLLQIANYNLEIAQKGIIFIDEIDKLRRKAGAGNTKDVSGEGVQEGFLKIIENSCIPINSGRKNHNEETVLFDTKNVLFIGGGAFETLFDRPSQNNPIGFQTEKSIPHATKQPELSHETLVKYGGLMPEFVGRFPILCSLEELTADDLIRILTEPKDAITKEYQLLFEKDDIKLEFTDDALEKIAEEAIQKNTGARSLRSILENVMLNIMYNIPDKKATISKCIIKKETIETGEPTIVKKRQRKKKAAVAASS